MYNYEDITLMLIGFALMGGFIGLLIRAGIGLRDLENMPLQNKGEEVPLQGEHVIVFAGSIIEADLIKLHLQEHGIEARLEDEHIGTMAPYAAPGGIFGAVKVAVSVIDESKAGELIERHQGQA
jgi:hypothetical protein